MTEYVEGSPKARARFFLALIVLGALALLVSRLDQLLPAIDQSDPLRVLDEVLERTLISAAVATLFWVGFSILSVHYWKRAVQSGQWPPVGMPVPFRTKVQNIKNLNRARLYLACLLLIYATQIAGPWFVYVKQEKNFRELKSLQMPPNKALHVTAASPPIK